MNRVCTKDGSWFMVSDDDFERVKRTWSKWLVSPYPGRFESIKFTLMGGGDVMLLVSEIQSLISQSDEDMIRAWQEERRLDELREDVYNEKEPWE